MLLLPLAAAGCGEDITAQLDACKGEIRSELTALLEDTRRQAAASMEVLEGATVITGEQVREASETPDAPVAADDKLSNAKIKTVADLFAKMAGTMIEAQLAVLEPTAADLAKCQAILADARRR